MTISADHPIRILLVDNNHADCEHFQNALLEIEPHANLTIADGSQLMDVLGNSAYKLPHLIFLDIEKPLKSGMEFLRDIQRTSYLNSIPVIFFTGSLASVDGLDTFAKSANLYVRKPQTFDFLKQTLKKILRLDWRKYMSDRPVSRYTYGHDVAKVA